MTYQELKTILENMNQEQLQMDVTIHVCGVDEFYKVDNDMKFQYGDDVLDDSHPYFEI